LRKEINRYQCVGDSGTEYTVIEYQNFRRYKPLSEPPQDVPTTEECFLSDGQDVNVINENTFQIVRTDEYVR
jgi:hypothetical protein